MNIYNRLPIYQETAEQATKPKLTKKQRKEEENHLRECFGDLAIKEQTKKTKFIKSKDSITKERHSRNGNITAKRVNKQKNVSNHFSNKNRILKDTQLNCFSNKIKFYD